MKLPNWKRLNQQIVGCNRCPRLVGHCQEIATKKRRAYQDQDYWGRPVPNMGQAPASLLVVGLAPGAHGANRTGRMFTGDRSGDWLFRALHRASFCNQPESVARNNGLELSDCVITAVCHCAPPDNKPTAQEIGNCHEFLNATFRRVQPKVVLCLGGLAWRETMRYAVHRGWLSRPLPKFGHEAVVDFPATGGKTPRVAIGCYHPSQQNTFTGRLTEAMLDDVMARVRRHIS